jgi:hypothetical protein
MVDQVVYQFRMGDVEDIDLYIHPVINKFFDSRKGRWLEERNIDLIWRGHDSFDYYTTIQFVAKMTEEQKFMYILKFGHDKEYLDH